MRFIASATLLFSLLFAKPESEIDDDHVLNLTDKTFEEKVLKAPEDQTVLVKFYTTWCGHCKSLAPEYAKTAKHFKEMEKDAKITLAHIDCDSHKEFCGKMGIEGYPTLKFFKGGKDWKYDGPRKEEEMIGYIKKQLLPLISEITQSQVETFSKSDQVVVISSIVPGSPDFKVYEKVVTRLRDEIVAANVKPTSAEDGKLPSSMSLYKKFDDGFAKYSGPWEEEALFSWISVESTPVMADINQKLYIKYMTEGGPLVYFFYDKPEQKTAQGKIVESIARNYKGKVNAVYIDGKTFGQHMVALNGEAGKYPSLLGHRIKEDLKFDFGSQDYTEATVKAFFEGLHQDKLVPKYRSDPIPKSDSGPIKVIVNENFEKVVLDVKKDVFVEVYAPWCGVCKRVEPLFEKLAKIYEKHSSKIVIGKMNGDSNDLPRVANLAITGFPTFVLYKSESNEKIVMNPTDKLEEMVEFISKNANHKIDVSKELKAAKEEKSEKDSSKDTSKSAKEEKAEL